MPPGLDETHSPALRSWVGDAIGHPEFPVQNLPLGVFRPHGGEAQGGVAIGDHILSLRSLAESGLLHGPAQKVCEAGAAPPLNLFFGMGAGPRQALRRSVSALLAEGAEPRPELLYRAADCELLLPAAIGDYTDFYAGIHHARNVGELFRPDQPLLPNYKWVPIGYHGRSSSVRVSGEPLRHPCGQRLPSGAAVPVFGPAQRLDFELELGFWTGPGNQPGEPIPVKNAAEHIAGYCLLNDWSARDLQAWEYQPLGPFLGKSFHTTVSGWIITPEALAPFRCAQASRPEGDPLPLPYLFAPEDQARGALAIELEVLLCTAHMQEAGLAPELLSRTHAGELYWTPAQMVAHHTSNGCNLRPGDLLGSGTISSPQPAGYGSLLEITRGGTEPITLRSGEMRTFLQDGDEVLLRAHARREGYVSVGFGECRARVLPAKGSTNCETEGGV